MPLYDYECKCGKHFEDIRPMSERACAPCPQCGTMANQVIGAPRVQGFKYGYFEHITDEPVYVKNKKHLKELCNRYECDAPGVLD